MFLCIFTNFLRIIHGENSYLPPSPTFVYLVAVVLRTVFCRILHMSAKFSHTLLRISAQKWECSKWNLFAVQPLYLWRCEQKFYISSLKSSIWCGDSKNVIVQAEWPVSHFLWFTYKRDKMVTSIFYQMVLLACTSVHWSTKMKCSFPSLIICTEIKSIWNLDMT